MTSVESNISNSSSINAEENIVSEDFLNPPKTSNAKKTLKRVFSDKTYDDIDPTYNIDYKRNKTASSTLTFDINVVAYSLLIIIYNSFYFTYLKGCVC